MSLGLVLFSTSDPVPAFLEAREIVLSSCVGLKTAWPLVADVVLTGNVVATVVPGVLVLGGAVDQLVVLVGISDSGMMHSKPGLTCSSPFCKRFDLFLMMSSEYFGKFIIMLGIEVS